MGIGVIAGAAGGLGVAAWLGIGAFFPRSRFIAPVISRGPDTPPDRIALTFDDGPDPQVTPAILDILRRHRVPATFFVIGEHARRHPDILRRTHDEGHLLANHSFDHSRWGMFHDRKIWMDQIRRTADVIHQATGQTTDLFRPPFGFKQQFVASAARRCSHRMVTWTRRGRDGWPTTPERILARLAHATRPGEIILLHDGSEPGKPASRKPTIEALSPLLDAFNQRALRPVRLDELLPPTPHR